MKNLLLVSILGLILFLPAASGCFDTPYKEGRDLYVEHCAGCHGDDGIGLLALVPPIVGSDYLVKYREQLPCIIRYGLEGPIEVNGRYYEGQMLGLPKLKEVEITNLLNYINTHFQNTNPEFSLEEVRDLLDACKK